MPGEFGRVAIGRGLNTLANMITEALGTGAVVELLAPSLEGHRC